MGVEDREFQPGFVVNFFVPFASRWRLGTLVAEATDECGNTRRIVQSFVRSGGFYPASTTVDDAAGVETASLTRLRWEVFDDGDRSTMNDATAILSVNVPQILWDDVIPKKIWLGNEGPCDCQKLIDTWPRSGYSVTVEKFEYPDPPPGSDEKEKKAVRGTPLKVATVRTGPNDRLRVDLFVKNVAIDVTVTSYACTAGLLSVAVRHGTVEFDDTLGAARFTLRTSDGDLELVVGAGAITVDTKTSANVQCDVDFLCDALTDFALPRLRGLISDQMSAATATEMTTPTALPSSGRIAPFSMGAQIAVAGAWTARVCASSARARSR